jgi:hypothetical protein
LLSVWALGVALCAVHGVAIGTVLGRAVDLLLLLVLTSGLATSGSLVPYWRKLRTTHLMRHHMRLTIVGRLTLGLRRVLTLALRLLAVPLVFLLASILLFLFLGLPLLADFFEFCITSNVSLMQLYAG